MKMDIFFGNLFWGILIILIGLSIILKGFNINIPLVKSFVAIIIILIGVRILVGSHHKPRTSGFSSSTTRGKVTEYSNVFSSGTYDLTDINPGTEKLEITVVFGSATVYLPEDVEFDFDSNAVLGAVIIPGRTHAGITNYDTKVNTGGKRRVAVEATSVFGRLEFIVKQGAKTKTDTPQADTTKADETGF